MMPTPVIAIIDIGKTNKKLFLFNEQYALVFEKSFLLKETIDEDGDACEDIVSLTKWVLDSVNDIIENEAFDIKALNFSTYGASFVCIGKNGLPLTPLYNYLKQFSEKLHHEFIAKYDSNGSVFIETASPDLGCLNSGLQLFRLKYEKPEIYKKIHYALHLPQYISYLFTKIPRTDITSIGCHTALWNYQEYEYHSWVTTEQIDQKFAPIIIPSSPTPVVLKQSTIQVGIGLHDSSAALIPYLKYFHEPFVLISTGTWCITLNPFNSEPLTPSDLANDCLCYMSYNNSPVKAARLFAGYEHEQIVNKLSAYYNKPIDYYKKITYNPELLDLSAINSIATNIKVGVHSSTFSSKSLDAFATYEVAYHQFIAAIIQQQKLSTTLVLGASITKIFVDGGFSSNEIYMNLLAVAFPTLKVYAALLPQSSARGAALVMHDCWNSNPLPQDLISIKEY